jgi:hypothetical protein
VKKNLVPAALALAVAGVLALGPFNIRLKADDDDHGRDSDRDRDHSEFRDRDHHSEFRGFVPGTIVISGTVYKGTADTVTVDEVLPPGCLNNGTVTSPTAATYNATLLAADQTPTTTTTQVTGIQCGYASVNGEYPNLNDSNNVWNNDATDGSFGITSPIVLWNVSPDGHVLGTLHVPSHEMVTSFSSKSEEALNRSADGKSLTIMGYRGGPGCPTLTLSASNVITQGSNVGPISPTRPNLIDVSASSTPGLCDPTNTAVSSYAGATGPTGYYRSVAEVDAWGRIQYTDNDAYSGDNSRASIKADNSLYYSVGNDNNGNLSKTQVGPTVLGFNLSHSTGAELITPGQTPLVPPANNMLGFFVIGKDKPGKDTNFRGETIFGDTLYVTKGSGGNGVNTVYQVGAAGTLPTTSNAPSGGTINEPIVTLPGFPPIAPTPDTSTTGATASAGGYYPFGIWFANADTLYVCNEGDLAYTANQTINGQVNVANSGDLAPNTMFSAGLQKWSLQNGTWLLQYVIQNGLNLGVPYSVKDYPASIEPAIGGCRNIIGTVNRDGTATIYAVTSTISQNGDNGADPNTVVKVTDAISATKLSTGGVYDVFTTIAGPRARVAYRGVALAPEEEFHGFGFGW